MQHTEVIHRIQNARMSSDSYLCLAMLCKHGLYHNVVSVCLSVMFVHSVKTNKHIFKKSSPPGSQTILVFAHQTI